VTDLDDIDEPYYCGDPDCWCATEDDEEPDDSQQSTVDAKVKDELL